MARVLIIRHGESTWNVERRWQGWLDAPLTPAGERQATQRARGIAHDLAAAPRAVFSSDLLRARRTAEIVAAHLEVPMIPDDGFRERHGGDWQGHTAAEIDERWPGMRAAWRRGELAAPPGGEDDAAVLGRFDAALARALDHVGRNVAIVVTHHGVLRVVATRAGADVHTVIPNLGGFWFDVAAGGLTSPEAVPALAPLEPEDPGAERPPTE